MWCVNLKPQTCFIVVCGGVSTAVCGGVRKAAGDVSMYIRD